MTSLRRRRGASRPRRTPDRSRVVIVTGASSGLGRATSLALADRGDRLVLAARGREALEQVADECRARGAESLVAPTDVGDPADVERLVQLAVQQFGRLDVCISAAAGLLAGDLQDQPTDEVRRIVTTNVLGSALVARESLVVFERQGHGTLVLVASLLGLVPNPVVPTYVATKFAVRGLALSLRQSVARLPDVHVSCVLPGPLDTPMFQHAANHTGRRLRSIPPAIAPERTARAVVSATVRPDGSSPPASPRTCCWSGTGWHLG